MRKGDTVASFFVKQRATCSFSNNNNNNLLGEIFLTFYIKDKHPAVLAE